MRKLIVLGGLVAVLAGVVHWQLRDADEFGPLAQGPESTAPAEQAASAPVAGASGAAQPEQPQAEVVQESNDTETTLESFIPRRSEGHAQNLHKTPSPILLGSSAVYVMDASDRKVLLEKNPDAVLPMASITKLMTAMVVLEGRQAMDQPLTITEDDIDRARMSRSRLRAGTVLSRDEALHLALMSSENRAAHALGRTYPGGMPAFVAAMNRKAKQLGMASTTYIDPTGLSEKNRTTARDLATLVLAASEYPVLREYSVTQNRRVQFGKRALIYVNSNALVRDDSWDITLQKTGYIVEAGHCVVQRARIGSRDVVMVLLDAGDNRTRNGDARRIRNYVVPGFEEAWAKAHPPATKAQAKAKAKEKNARDKDTKTAAAKKGDKKEDKSSKSAAASSRDDKPAKSRATEKARAKDDDKPARVTKTFKKDGEDT
ncbi:serine hydrolase [Ramlibacter sp.]|uniref:serine hydrolase n=1 Tax=Ramlibacter sp. TaxID=1917967 RepID=UPI003D136325